MVEVFHAKLHKFVKKKYGLRGEYNFFLMKIELYHKLPLPEIIITQQILIEAFHITFSKKPMTWCMEYA